MKFKWVFKLIVLSILIVVVKWAINKCTDTENKKIRALALFVLTLVTCLIILEILCIIYFSIFFFIEGKLLISFELLLITIGQILFVRRLYSRSDDNFINVLIGEYKKQKQKMKL